MSEIVLDCSLWHENLNQFHRRDPSTTQQPVVEKSESALWARDCLKKSNMARLDGITGHLGDLSSAGPRLAGYLTFD